MKRKKIAGSALVYCQNAFNTPEGKTAHGLVRFTERYKVVGIIDNTYTDQDAGKVLDNRPNGIPIFADFTTAIEALEEREIKVNNFVIGLAPDGGRLPKDAKEEIRKALEMGLDVASGLHDFLTNDKSLVKLAKKNECTIKDVRKTPDRDQLHFFTGEIENVNCLKLAVLGTDSAVGKRTTAWMIVHAFRNAGRKAEMIGTGQTAWMQGAKYSMIMDSCINDFVSGEIEHAIVSTWNDEEPDVI
ncbi:MAG: putative NAD-dependent epimerase/dehydratase family protein, partial [Paraglaciecola sp.]